MSGTAGKLLCGTLCGTGILIAIPISMIIVGSTYECNTGATEWLMVTGIVTLTLFILQITNRPFYSMIILEHLALEYVHTESKI